MQFTVNFRREEHSIQNSLHRLLLLPPPPPCLPLLVCFLRLDPGELTSPLPLYYGKMMAEMKGSVSYMVSTWKHVAILMWSCEKKCPCCRRITRGLWTYQTEATSNREFQT